LVEASPLLKILKIDFNAWSYSLRTACAACLALYISFSLNLDDSHWAFTTCYIVGGQRLQGKIMAKSLARIVGTLVGAIASFVLVNAFAQHGVLFITCFAAWLSLCHAAVLAAVRVFVAVGLAAVFWIATAWPAGDKFLVWAGLASCRYTITPDPARATQATFRGMIFAAAPTYLITFYLLPQMDGFTMLVLALLPLIVVGVGIGTSLGRAGEVGAAMLILGSGMDPTNTMQYDVVAFFNGVLATIMGVGVVCLTHAITFPTDTAWKRRIAERRLIQRITRALQESRLIPFGYLGSVVRTLNDCLLLCGDHVEGDPGQADALINLCTLGYEVITLERGGDDMPAELLNYRRRLVSTVTQFLQQPSALQLSRAEK
jgi:uncharacterized membrane protein YccC